MGFAPEGQAGAGPGQRAGEKGHVRCGASHSFEGFCVVCCAVKLGSVPCL